MNSRSVVSIAILALLWELLARYFIQLPALFPPLTEIVGNFADYYFILALVNHYIKTLFRSTLGFIAGLLFGLITGLFMVIRKNMVDYVSPLATLMFSVPSVAWIPVLIVLIGINELTLPLVASFMCSYPPILYGVINSFRVFDKDLLDIANVYCTKKLTKYRYIVLPYILTLLLPSIKTEAIMVWKTVFVVEMLALSNGLGYIALLYATSLKMSHLLAVIFVLSMTLLAINSLIDTIEKRLTGLVSRGDAVE
ncbi:MAG: ABC transporter permease subunit [Desulfurococcaceae archaeon]